MKTGDSTGREKNKLKLGMIVKENLFHIIVITGGIRCYIYLKNSVLTELTIERKVCIK